MLAGQKAAVEEQKPKSPTKILPKKEEKQKEEKKTLKRQPSGAAAELAKQHIPAKLAFFSSGSRNRFWRKNRLPTQCTQINIDPFLFQLMKVFITPPNTQCCQCVDLNRNFDWFFGQLFSTINVSIWPFITYISTRCTIIK
uniref:Peptidase M14 domain-containing protein n=1 Tax=Meloidogyne incognita TaxID=6306 RepID=A0A914NI50_MELIC